MLLITVEWVCAYFLYKIKSKMKVHSRSTFQSKFSANLKRFYSCHVYKTEMRSKYFGLCPSIIRHFTWISTKRLRWLQLYRQYNFLYNNFIFSRRYSKRYLTHFRRQLRVFIFVHTLNSECGIMFERKRIKPSRTVKQHLCQCVI